MRRARRYEASRGELMANIDTLLAFHREQFTTPNDQGLLFGTMSAPRVSLSAQGRAGAAL